MSTELAAVIMTVRNELALEGEKHNVSSFQVHLEGITATEIRCALLQDTSVADAEEGRCTRNLNQ